MPIRSRAAAAAVHILTALCAAVGVVLQCGFFGGRLNLAALQYFTLMSNILCDALKIVENLEHRAGKDAEGKTGDGVGILVQISHKFFKKACDSLGIFIGQERDYGVGMFFMPQDELKRNRAKKMFEIIVEKEGLNFLGWRECINTRASPCRAMPAFNAQLRGLDGDTATDFAGSSSEDGSILSISASLWPGFEW